MTPRDQAPDRVLAAGPAAPSDGVRWPDGGAAAPGPFMLLGDDTAPGCVGDACALPTPATPSAPSNPV